MSISSHLISGHEAEIAQGPRRATNDKTQSNHSESAFRCIAARTPFPGRIETRHARAPQAASRLSHFFEVGLHAPLLISTHTLRLFKPHRRAIHAARDRSRIGDRGAHCEG